ncbi:hypothetical protein BJX62DRAFT_104157 [Aspergillus germanicus]
MATLSLTCRFLRMVSVLDPIRYGVWAVVCCSLSSDRVALACLPLHFLPTSQASHTAVHPLIDRIHSQSHASKSTNTTFNSSLSLLFVFFPCILPKTRGFSIASSLLLKCHLIPLLF